MHFKNRREAGKLLAQKLTEYKNKAVVFALPRGGVVLGAEVARELNVPLSLIFTRKIGHPMQSEYSIAAVSESGEVVVNKNELKTIDETWFEKEVEKQKKEIQRRKKLYVKKEKTSAAKGKIAIIVDDGVATGFTMKVAVKELVLQHPKKIIIASPVVFPGALEMFNDTKAEIIALDTSDDKQSISSYYDVFPQVTDKEVVRLLSQVKQ